MKGDILKKGKRAKELYAKLLYWQGLAKKDLDKFEKVWYKSISSRAQNFKEERSQKPEFTIDMFQTLVLNDLKSCGDSAYKLLEEPTISRLKHVIFIG
jgi:hypothetical protein